ncbi:hypothetical protein AVDCRST_MAG92-3103 [uncultured Coleofasciculus sp.]|uniref:Uncharacterized protein n=1 Tax=uncultured Coleofasciculus sp. TaxID=1267456 RepID=A0A6J4JAI7_9CYAN|nr:hypothetical protein AVDCRST_MAG92-3103 [uncultured Coleofasciculus sp.]
MRYPSARAHARKLIVLPHSAIASLGKTQLKLAAFFRAPFTLLTSP